MSIWRQLTFGFRGLFRGDARKDEIAEELRQYFDEEVAARMAQGFSREEAQRATRLEIGGAASAQDDASNYGWEVIVRRFSADLHFAARQLVKHPAFTITAALTLALGIGANTAIFTVVESVLLAPLPYRNADRIVALETRWTDTGHSAPRVTGPDAADIRDQSHDFEAVSLYNGGSEGVQLRDHSVYTTVMWVDANFARVFDLQPIAGRLLTDADAHHAALVSEDFARDNYGNSQAALGQMLHIENEPVEIAGVLPAGFKFPAKTQVWESTALTPESKSRTAFNYKAVALRRAGITPKAAQAELDGIAQRLQGIYPADNRNKQFSNVPLQQALTGDVRPSILLLWATVGLILLIACANVTHLQLVRSMERQREIAIRKALGASRWQVIQPVMLESLLIALLGGGAGVLLAFPAVSALVAIAPKELPRAQEIHLNLWVLAFTLLLAVITAVASSLAPALRAAKVDAADALKQDATRGMTKRGSGAFRDMLVVAEIAATFLLATGAGLLVRTMMNLSQRDMGYETRQLLVVDADAPAHTEQDAHRAVQQFNDLFAKLGALPGVEHVAGIMGLPTGNYGSNGYYQTRGGLPAVPGHDASAIFSVASPGYFAALGIPMKGGRDFGATDTYDGQFVAIVSESLARQSFGDVDPIGKQIQCGLDSDKWMTIIGVVGDVRQDSPAEKPGATLYMPMAQHPYFANQIHVVLRTHIKPLTLMNTVQKQILGENPLIAMRFTTMDEMVSQSMAAERFRAVLISSFAAAGLLLAMLGVYGTMAYTVAQRTFEIGIRMAFGAEKQVILGGVLRHAAKLAVIGIVVGAGLSFLLARLVTSILVGVRPIDPVSLGVAATLLLLTAVCAALAPGWKATHVEPMRALRS